MFKVKSIVATYQPLLILLSIFANNRMRSLGVSNLVFTTCNTIVSFEKLQLRISYRFNWFKSTTSEESYDWQTRVKLTKLKADICGSKFFIHLAFFHIFPVIKKKYIATQSVRLSHYGYKVMLTNPLIARPRYIRINNAHWSRLMYEWLCKITKLLKLKKLWKSY